MIQFENVEVVGFGPSMRGMRNPRNSWGRSDSHKGLSGDEWSYDPGFIVGEADHGLAMKLSHGGPCHAKYRRFIIVYVDIIAPLYWWKEFDTYRIGVEKNSCSTMHTIAEKEFDRSDFSCEHLTDGSLFILDMVIKQLNTFRALYNEATDPEKKKTYWWQMIQLLPTSYNQRRTVMVSYEALFNMNANGRANHKQDEWRELCAWSHTLPYAEMFAGDGLSNSEPKTNVKKKESHCLHMCVSPNRIPDITEFGEGTAVYMHYEDDGWVQIGEVTENTPDKWGYGRHLLVSLADYVNADGLTKAWRNGRLKDEYRIDAANGTKKIYLEERGSV